MPGTSRKGPRLSPLVPGLRRTRKGFLELFGSIPAAPGGEGAFPDEMEEEFNMPALVIDDVQRAQLAARGYVIRKKRKKRR